MAMPDTETLTADLKLRLDLLDFPCGKALHAGKDARVCWS